MDLKFFLCVIGLMMIFEGLPFAAFPYKFKEMIRQILELPESNLRIFGLILMAMGLLLVYLGRS